VENNKKWDLFLAEPSGQPGNGKEEKRLAWAQRAEREEKRRGSKGTTPREERAIYQAARRTSTRHEVGRKRKAKRKGEINGTGRLRHGKNPYPRRAAACLRRRKSWGRVPKRWTTQREQTVKREIWRRQSVSGLRTERRYSVLG